MNRVSKVSFMWVVIMVGFAMHMLADMLPAFWGVNIAMPDATGEAPVGMLIFMMSLSFFIPMCGLLCMQYRRCKAMLTINLVLAGIMMVFNIFHASELIAEEPELIVEELDRGAALEPDDVVTGAFAEETGALDSLEGTT